VTQLLVRLPSKVFHVKSDPPLIAAIPHSCLWSSLLVIPKCTRKASTYPDMGRSVSPAVPLTIHALRPTETAKTSLGLPWNHGQGVHTLYLCKGRTSVLNKCGGESKYDFQDDRPTLKSLFTVPSRLSKFKSVFVPRYLLLSLLFLTAWHHLSEQGSLHCHVVFEISPHHVSFLGMAIIR
jgi:hypothetical protein